MSSDIFWFLQKLFLIFHWHPLEMPEYLLQTLTCCLWFFLYQKCATMERKPRGNTGPDVSSQNSMNITKKQQRGQEIPVNCAN